MEATDSGVLPFEKPVLAARGSLRVQAWIYAALNPIADACRREHDAIHRDPGWRHTTLRFDHLHPISERLTRGGRDDLEDLLRFAGGLAPLVAAQEEGCSRAARAAAALHADLVGDPRFQKAVREGRRDHRLPLTDAELAARAADRVVNGGDGDAAAPDAAYWRGARHDLLWVAGDRRSVVAEALHELDQAVLALGRTVVELRARLCDEFDLPPAPPR